MLPGLRTIRPRRFTLLDILYLVGIAAIVCAAIGSVGRAGSTAGLLAFAAASLTIHALTGMIFLVAGLSARRGSAWRSTSLFGFYLIVGVCFLIQIVLLITTDPWNGFLVFGSVLGMLFYWVSWS